ncbi:DUF4062 domain-containing protein [Roseibium sp. MMSF_3544]|uniref:DUF4062 domain-containing protein n=1 Tax=unclassified Roseibium TaxID=2629323 RepID=UPI0027400BA1|nr:DUF4062 domain-containing protein [Roseibium sp. MMSF_3544]
MRESLKIVRIFIGSPGGLDKERNAAHHVVGEVNRNNSEHWGCHFKLYGWEDAIPGYQRPQSKINEDLDRCDYFIGVMWNKWGSRPSTDANGYTSGFEEEYCRAIDRIESGNMKDMALFFKTIDSPEGFQPGEDIQKVLDFRQSCIEEKKVFFKDFNDTSDFKDVVRDKLMEIGWRETSFKPFESVEDDGSEAPPEDDSDTETTASSASRLIEENAGSFLSDVANRSYGWDAVSSQEVARFRLISTTLHRSGNDEIYLENHDANLIFKHYRDEKLSDREYNALVECGVIGFTHRNVPLWRWVQKSGDLENQFFYLRFLSQVGTQDEQQRSIRILKLLGQPLIDLSELISKRKTLQTWLSNETKDQVFDAAVSFLATNAVHEDIPLLEEMSNDCDPKRKQQIEGAVVAILARGSTDSALKRLCRNEVDKVESRVADDLFSSPQSLLSETLVSCLSAKQDEIRLRAARVLFDRSEIPKEAIDSLLTDNMHEIRLIAAETLANLDQALTDEVLKKALTIERRAVGLGIALGSATRKETDTKFYERYRVNRLSELSFTDLKSKVEKAGVFNEQELTVLYSRFRSKTQSDIRKNLADGFRSQFETELKKLAANSGVVGTAAIENIRKLGPFLTNKLSSSALSILCELRNRKDLDLVRKTIDSFEIDASESITRYLGRFGEWPDVERIKKLGDYPSEGSLVSFRSTKLPQQKASAILALGRQRVADTLDLELDSQIRDALLKLIPNKLIASLSDDIVIRELGRKNDSAREIFAIRCVQSIPKKRLTSLLDNYVDGENQRYYNSVHWLDLGTSLPSRLAKSVAENWLR